MNDLFPYLIAYKMMLSRWLDTREYGTFETHASDPVNISSRTYPRDDIPDILGGKLDALPGVGSGDTTPNSGGFRWVPGTPHLTPVDN